MFVLQHAKGQQAHDDLYSGANLRALRGSLGVGASWEAPPYVAMPQLVPGMTLQALQSTDGVQLWGYHTSEWTSWPAAVTALLGNTSYMALSSPASTNQEQEQEQESRALLWLR